MEQEYPFRPRGRHGFDREDVINYIAQAQQRCNEHLARMEELEAAKNAWYTQAKGMEREKATLVARNRELEEQLERGGAAIPAGGEWFQADPMLASFQESQELAAVRSRCLELEERLEQQNALMGAQEAQQERTAAAAQQAADALRAQIDSLRGENAALAEENRAKDDELPRFTLHQQEVDDLRAHLNQQVAAVNAQAAATQEQAARVIALEQEKTVLEQQLGQLRTQAEGLLSEKAALEQRLSSLVSEQTAYAAQMPALQEKLAALESEQLQITSLEAAKAALTAELDEARLQLDEAAQDAAGQAQAIESAQQDLAALRTQADSLRIERDTLSQHCAELSQEEALARQKYEGLVTEAGVLRAQISAMESEMEGQKTQNQPSEETLRSMVLASFNYSNLYVDNNLKTAQFISEATSRNIGRVSDSANSLLEQLEAIARSFNDTTDGIRRNLGSFQRELGTIQTGMNRRLGKDRFAALLEENEKLRVRLETELLEELSSEEEERPAPLSGGEGAKLPFAEDLPKDYHEYLDN